VIAAIPIMKLERDEINRNGSPKSVFDRINRIGRMV